MGERVLRLTLHKKAFEVMKTGEKFIEYRKPTRWIMSRLVKDYDVVEFVNGYGKTRPRFRAKFLGFHTIMCPQYFEYSNGLKVYVEWGDIAIKLGDVEALK
jgi:hypothetical protein